MTLSTEGVERLANLARIELSPREAADVLGHLDRVLALVEQLKSADTEGIEPMAHPAEASRAAALRLREDRVTETDRRSLYQSVAPRVEKGLYLVPLVIE